MRILVLYYQEYEKGIRRTIHEHLYSFKRYSRANCHYLNVSWGVPWYISKIPFDLIIYHYTIFACKWELAHFIRFQKKWGNLKKIMGYKVAIPLDEYIHSEAVNKFFQDFGIKSVFTALSETEWQKVYPKEASGLEHYVTVFTGYIDEEAVKEISAFRSENRYIDIGYRARKLPYWIGRHGQLKTTIAKHFLNAAVPHRLNLDISLNPEDVFFGNDWYRFLCRCRTALGCEGGASLHDPTGNIRKKVDDYVARHPEASFDEVEQVCFPGQDGNLNLFALSPRHFECAITKTCQVLVEGEYAGVLKPGKHYIEVKKDWSNIAQVIRQIEDRTYCEKIAENAYRDIVQSELYTYRRFVQTVMDHIRELKSSPNEEKCCMLNKFFLYLLDQRERLGKLFMFISFLKVVLKKAIKNFLSAMGLLGYYYRLRGY